MWRSTVGEDNGCCHHCWHLWSGILTKHIAGWLTQRIMLEEAYGGKMFLWKEHGTLERVWLRTCLNSRDMYTSPSALLACISGKSMIKSHKSPVSKVKWMEIGTGKQAWRDYTWNSTQCLYFYNEKVTWKKKKNRLAHQWDLQDKTCTLTDLDNGDLKATAPCSHLRYFSENKSEEWLKYKKKTMLMKLQICKLFLSWNRKKF